MKRVILCSVLVAIMVGAGIWGMFYTQGVIKDSRESLSRVIEAYNDDNSGLALKSAQALEERWDSFCDIHIFVTDNEHALEISQLTAKIRSLAEEMDDELLAECAAADKLLRLFAEEQAPTFFNIL